MRVTLKGIARFAKHTPIRAPPITLELLLKVISVSISRILGRSPFSKHFSPFSCLFAFRILYPCRHPSLISHYICAGEIFSSSRVSFWFCSNGLMNAVYSYLWYPFREASLSRDHYRHVCELVPALSHASAFIFSVSHKGGYPLVSKTQFVSFLSAKLSLAGVTHP